MARRGDGLGAGDEAAAMTAGPSLASELPAQRMGRSAAGRRGGSGSERGSGCCDSGGPRPGPDIVRLLFFGPGERAEHSEGTPAFFLHVGQYDPSMLGKACHHSTTDLLTVWVRARLSPLATAWVTLHEVRHVWQGVADFEGADDEEDANRYAWSNLPRLGATPTALRRVAEEIGFQFS